MRIISNFTDTYDGVFRSNDRTELPVYIRNWKAYEIPIYLPGGAGVSETARVLEPAIDMLDMLPVPKTYKNNWYMTMHIEKVVIVICGKIIPGYYANLADVGARPVKVWYSPETVIDAFLSGALYRPNSMVRQPYTPEEYAACIEWNENNPSDRRIFSHKHDIRRADTLVPAFSPDGLEAYAKLFPGEKRILPPEAHIYFNRAPILALTHEFGRVTLHENAKLRDFGFNGMKPFDVWQTLDMYLGNELAQQPDPVPVRTQELIRDAHGFDRNSFRNTKPDRRARKAK